MTSVEAQNQSLNQSLSSRAQSLETTLDKFLPRMKGGEANLIEAMRYAVLGGGEKIKGLSCYRSRFSLQYPNEKRALCGRFC